MADMKDMISPVSSANAVPASSIQQTPPAPKAQAGSSPQDTVHLSKQALAAAGGDVDHDGDSH